MMWYLMVKPGGPWDHKPKLIEMFDMDTENWDDMYFDVPGTDYRVRLDIWSNIHYGFVGSELGFGIGDLLLGANVPGLAGKNEPADDMATLIGIMMSATYDPSDLTRSDFESGVISGLDLIIRSEYGDGPVSTQGDGYAGMVECKIGLTSC